jgi:hypothetical protein
MIHVSWFLFPLFFLFIFGPFRRRYWRRRAWNRDWDGMPGEHDRDPERAQLRAEREKRERQREEQIEQLETRVAELESRLDYTERLLTQRRESQPVVGPTPGT